jgi:hypothetical protein
MSDLHFFENGFAPRPKDEVRIEEIEIAVYPDRFRVFLHVRVTPFLERPNLLITARTADGRVASELNVIETMHHDMEFTLHLRGISEPAGAYTLTVEVFYETRNPPADRRIEPFTVPQAGEAEDAP